MEGEEDRLSLLPDCMLGTIVSLLPPKAAARTAVLSRRWRSIWHSLPLDLDLQSEESDLRWVDYGRSISRILSGHRGPIRSVRSRFHRLDKIGCMLRALKRKPVADTLVLEFATQCFAEPMPLLPCSLLAHSLRRLQLHWCRLGLPDQGPDPTFPHLDYLHLSNVDISESALHRLLDGCISLREIELFRVRGLQRIVLRSRKLTTVYIRPHIALNEISFHEASSLETISLEYVDLWRVPTVTGRVGAPPKLRQVALTVPMLDKDHASIHSRKLLPIVTLLVLNMKFTRGYELMKAADILSLFPSLQCLDVWCLNFNFMGSYVGRWQQPEDGTITCLNMNLVHVQFRGYCGAVGEVEFARFLLAKAKVLTTMEIIHDVDWSKEDIESQKQSICIRGKASSAQIYFMKQENIKSIRRQVAFYVDGEYMI